MLHSVEDFQIPSQNAPFKVTVFFYSNRFFKLIKFPNAKRVFIDYGSWWAEQDETGRLWSVRPDQTLWLRQTRSACLRTVKEANFSALS